MGPVKFVVFVFMSAEAQTGGVKKHVFVLRCCSEVERYPANIVQVIDHHTTLILLQVVIKGPWKMFDLPTHLAASLSR